MLALRVDKGFSLIECLVAMGIFASILCVCEGMFVIQHKAMTATTQDTDRIGVIRQLLLRMEPLVAAAGYLGVHSVASDLPLRVQGALAFSGMPTQAITIYRAQGNSWYPSLPTVLQGKVARDTDVVLLESAGLWHATVLSMTEEKGIHIATSAAVESGWFVIADGQQADIFWAQAHRTHSGMYIIPSKSLPHYGHYAVVSPWQMIAVYAQEEAAAYALMQKSLLPLRDSVSIMPSLGAFHVEKEGGLLRFSVMYEGVPMALWMGSVNAHLS